MTEKERILQMVADGKISVDDGERLIRAIGETEKSRGGDRNITQYAQSEDSEPRNVKLVIDIKSVKGESYKFQVPLKLAKWLSKFVPEDKLSLFESEGIFINEIISNVSEFIEDAYGKEILNMESANGDQIRIYLERP